jgi:hypothetical protein
MQPLSEFPAGPRRFFCRKHLYRRCTLPAKKRIQADDKRRLFNQLWARCSRDSKALGQTRIQLDQREIAEIVEDRGIDAAAEQQAGEVLGEPRAAATQLGLEPRDEAIGRRWRRNHSLDLCGYH